MTVGLLAADVEGWAFDQNNSDIIEYCSSEKLKFRKDFFGNSKLPTNWDVDFVFCPWHRQLPFYSVRTMLGSLRSEWFNASLMIPPTQSDINLVNSCAGFHVVTRGVYEDLKNRCLNVCYLTNPVNMKRFTKQAKKRNEIICCWNGNASHNSGNQNDIKGLYTILLPAISKSEKKFIIAEYNTCRLQPSAMPFFYQRANVALCASMYEGASNSTMEAMASGLALVTTDVGNHREIMESQIQHYGDTGIIIVPNRSIDSFSKAISSITPDRAYEMGEINRKEIAERWSWDFWRDDYLKFFRMAY